MSLYRNGALIGSEPRRPVIVIDKEKASDNFWTAVKWVGAALVLVTGYREAKYFWRKNLYGEQPPEEQGSDE